MVKFFQVLIGFVTEAPSLGFDEWIIGILNLLDLALLGNLVLIVTFSGYENFVSKIDVAEAHVDRPSWMGRLDFSGLKLKIVGSIVAISLIELLQDFLYAINNVDPTIEFWRASLHIIFVVTGVLFATMEYLIEKKHKIEKQNEE